MRFSKLQVTHSLFVVIGILLAISDADLTLSINVSNSSVNIILDFDKNIGFLKRDISETGYVSAIG